MTIQEVREDIMTFGRIITVWKFLNIKEYSSLDDTLSGFLSDTCWGKFYFDTTYTRDRMVRDWKMFLIGISWAMNN
jgi:hypothetical protein